MIMHPQCDCAQHQPCPCSGPRCTLCALDPRHGSTNGYTNCRCRCEPCRAINAAWCYGADKRRKAKGEIPERVHGTPGGYGNWGCKCPRCKQAWSNDTQDRRRRAKRGLTLVQQGLMGKPIRRTLNKQEVSDADTR